MAGAKRRTGLGRGLGALLEDSEQLNESNISVEFAAKPSISEIKLDSIEVNPFQPRTDFDKVSLNELADSIRVQGIIQPITVRKLNDYSYQLISGERRLQASKIAGLKAIPAYIRSADDQQMLELALIENIQRENLNAIEVALSYQRLLTECKLKQEELGDRVGKNRSTVNNYLRLLKLPPEIQAALRDNQLSMGHARALLSIDKLEPQLALFKKIIKDSLSVRKVEELARKMLDSKEVTEKQAPKEKNHELVNLQDRLSSHFGTKIKVNVGTQDDKGEIKIPFTSTDDLNRILDIIDI